MSDEQRKDEEVEAHRRHLASIEHDAEGESDDDVEGHRRHLASIEPEGDDDEVEAHVKKARPSTI
jgi:hypothetical protein